MLKSSNVLACKPLVPHIHPRGTLRCNVGLLRSVALRPTSGDRQIDECCVLPNGTAAAEIGEQILGSAPGASGSSLTSH
jgi:hypothetical protein